MHIFYLYAVGLSGLHLHFMSAHLDALAGSPVVHQRVAVHEQAQPVIAADGKDERFVFLRRQCALHTGGEVLEIYARGEDGIAAVAQFQRLLGVDYSHGLTLLLSVVPISDLQSLSALWVADGTELALDLLIPRESAAEDVFGGRYLADAFEGGDGLRGITAIVAPHHHGVVGVGAHDDNLSIWRFQWQNAVVL